MGANGLDEYWVPEQAKDYLRKLGRVYAGHRRSIHPAMRVRGPSRRRKADTASRFEAAIAWR